MMLSGAYAALMLAGPPVVINSADPECAVPVNEKTCVSLPSW
jgi:hypothetical protein